MNIALWAILFYTVLSTYLLFSIYQILQQINERLREKK